MPMNALKGGGETSFRQGILLCRCTSCRVSVWRVSGQRYSASEAGDLRAHRSACASARLLRTNAASLPCACSSVAIRGPDPEMKKD